eukprot:5509794-Pleurochrysis_carterae.AAC.2
MGRRSRHGLAEVAQWTSHERRCGEGTGRAASMARVRTILARSAHPPREALFPLLAQPARARGLVLRRVTAAGEPTPTAEQSGSVAGITASAKAAP